MYYVLSCTQSIEAESEQEAKNIFEQKLLDGDFCSENFECEIDDLEEVG
jgi:hypothetical protein